MAEQNTTEQFDNDEISLKELVLKILKVGLII